MKSILMSVQPYWVYLIIAKKMGWDIEREKTVEVRKSCPKAEDWDRVVKIYCSKDRKSLQQIPKKHRSLMESLLGKVVGEFLCNEIIKYPYETFSDGAHFMPFGELEKTCLDGFEIYDYLGVKDGYGWHISNLVFYDNPRELSEFSNGSSKFTFDDNGKFVYTRMPRPPQSWCYVESEV